MIRKLREQVPRPLLGLPLVGLPKDSYLILHIIPNRSTHMLMHLADLCNIGREKAKEPPGSGGLS